jgi:hypothetical protein
MIQQATYSTGAGGPPRLPRRYATLVILMCSGLIAGCAPTAVASRPAASQTTPSAAPTATRAAKGGEATTNVCPGGQPPTNAASFAPDVTVGEDIQQRSLTLRQGQRLEVRLDSQTQWVFSTSGAQNALTSTIPGGWYDPASQSCVWRFEAKAAGQVTLTYTGGAPCPPLKLCPAIERSVTFQVTIH